MQWHREKDLKQAAFKLIATTLLQAQDGGNAHAGLDPLSLKISGGAPSSPSQAAPGGTSSSTSVRRAVFLSAAYRQVSLTLGNSVNAFADMSRMLALFNVDVTDDPTALQPDGSQLPIIVILCPGVFDNLALLNMFESVLNEPAREVAKRKRADHLGASEADERSRPTLIPLFSTVLPFSCYMSNCNELAPHLKAYGIFNHMFHCLAQLGV